MPIRTETWTFARPVPYLLERAVAQTIQAPIRHGTAGALVAPTEAGSTITVQRADGTLLLNAVQITDVLDSVAVHDLTAAMLPASATLGEGWEVRWSLLLSDGGHTFRQAAYLCEYVPPCTVSVVDLYGRLPELRYRIPQAQGPTTEGGDGTGWQTQIDIAYYELLRKLIDDGRRPWLIREVTGYYEWLLARSVQLCVAAIPGGGPDHWTTGAARNAHFAMREASGKLRLQYSTEAPTRRRGGGPTIRLAPVERARGW